MKIVFALLTLFASASFAQYQNDLPQDGESFPTYFARITRGGKFPGIYLDAPTQVQNAFFKRIAKGSWVGLRDKEMRELEAQGINLWQGWYLETKPAALVLATDTAKKQTETSYNQFIKDNPDCKEQCPTFEELYNAEWDKLDSWKRALWIKNLVTQAPIFGGHTLLWHLTSLYQLDEKAVYQNVDIKIENHADFVNTVRQMGWGGEVYFRGITGADPKNPSRHWIVLDDEALRKGSPFEYPLYHMLEIAGILTHELSHVCQDLEGTSLGYSIEVTSAEDALIIEGMAETYAESALYNAGNDMGGIEPWKLFAREQAVEIVFREGNDTTGNLFPYTIGLPFVTSLTDLPWTHNERNLRQALLQFLDATPLHNGKQKPSLNDWLKQYWN